MQLFYVEHSVLTTQKYALLAKDEDDLKRILEERERTIREAQFVAKLERDKQGKVIGHQLNSDWDSGCQGPKWDGKL